MTSASAGTLGSQLTISTESKREPKVWDAVQPLAAATSSRISLGPGVANVTSTTASPEVCTLASAGKVQVRVATSLDASTKRTASPGSARAGDAVMSMSGPARTSTSCPLSAATTSYSGTVTRTR